MSQAGIASNSAGVIPFTAAANFTPQILFNGVALGDTLYTTQFGRYQIIGTCLTFELNIVLLNTGTAAPTAVASVSGLPVVSRNDNNVANYVSTVFNLVAAPAASTYYATELPAASAAMIIYGYDPGGGIRTALTRADFAVGGFTIRIQGSYFT